MAISRFCCEIHFPYWLSVPALGGVGPNDVVCKTCIVLLCVFEQPRVDNSSAGPNWFYWLKPGTTGFLPLKYLLYIIGVVSFYGIKHE